MQFSNMRGMLFFSYVFQNSRINQYIYVDVIFMRHTYARLVIQSGCHVSRYMKCLLYLMVLRLKKELLVVPLWMKLYWNFSITKNYMN